MARLGTCSLIRRRSRHGARSVRPEASPLTPLINCKSAAARQGLNWRIPETPSPSALVAGFSLTTRRTTGKSVLVDFETHFR